MTHTCVIEWVTPFLAPSHYPNNWLLVVNHQIIVTPFSLLDEARQKNEVLIKENKRLREELDNENRRLREELDNENTRLREELDNENNENNRLREELKNSIADVMHYRSEMLAMETRYERQIKVSEEKHQKQMEEMAELNKSLIAHNEKIYEKCQRIVKEMQTDYDEKQEDIIKELRSQLEERDGRHRRMVASMTAEYIKVMEDTSEQKRYMDENLNSRDQKEHDCIAELHRKHNAEVQMVRDCRKGVEDMKHWIATKRMERQQEELHAVELARQSAGNVDRLFPRKIPSSHSQDYATQLNSNGAENVENYSWRSQRPPFGDEATLRAWLASHRPPAQGPLKVFRPVNDFTKQSLTPRSRRLSSPALQVM